MWPAAQSYCWRLLAETSTLLAAHESMNSATLPFSARTADSTSPHSRSSRRPGGGGLQILSHLVDHPIWLARSERVELPTF